MNVKCISEQKFNLGFKSAFFLLKNVNKSALPWRNITMRLCPQDQNYLFLPARMFYEWKDQFLPLTKYICIFFLCREQVVQIQVTLSSCPNIACVDNGCGSKLHDLR